IIHAVSHIRYRQFSLLVGRLVGVDMGWRRTGLSTFTSERQNRSISIQLICWSQKKFTFNKFKW
ncbi:MAG: hypothetical protein JW755_03075, partial [Candidatus Aminicenantes bacterium]|nr:hypothetical protein [Candidatus Aminicenantes bacterium]